MAENSDKTRVRRSRKAKPIKTVQAEDEDKGKISNAALEEEQERIETRQIRNIFKMMNLGEEDSENRSQKRREASPYLNYAMEKYGLETEQQVSISTSQLPSDRESKPSQQQAAQSSAMPREKMLRKMDTPPVVD